MDKPLDSRESYAEASQLAQEVANVWRSSVPRAKSWLPSATDLR